MRARAERTAKQDADQPRRPQASAIQHGIALVAARSYPERALHEKIARRYGPDEAETALARLRELGLVDDAAWAERYARVKLERGIGPHRIRSELTARGIARDIVESAIDALVGADAELERTCAAKVLEVLRRRCREPVAHDAAPRLFRQMIARGWPADLVRELLAVD